MDGLLLHKHFLALAYQFAKEHSPDPRTQNGAVLVQPEQNHIIAFGANRFPKGVENRPERLTPEYKRDYLEHAERDAILSAAREGKSTLNTILYVPWFACADCAKAIINAGIQLIVGHSPPCKAETAWNESIAIGLGLLHEAGIKILYIDETLGVPGVRFGGKTHDR